MRGLHRILVMAALLGLGAARPIAAQPMTAQPDGVTVLLNELEAALPLENVDPLARLFAVDVDPAAITAFRSEWFAPGISAAVVRERDRARERDTGRLRLVLEVLLEFGSAARMLTWQATAAESDGRWSFASLSGVASLEGLHRVELDPGHQFEATDLRIAAEDFELRLRRGRVFLASVQSGVTAVVLLGHGEMRFEPTPETERRQLELFDGATVLHKDFRAAFVRLNPLEFRTRVSEDALREVPVNERDLEEAQAVFRTESVKSFAVDLGELSRDAWSLLPSYGDFLAEVRTRGLGTLTYVRAADEFEDVTLFDRARRRNISVYTSQSRLASRGPFYHEDERRAYDVVDYNVDATFAPDRLWFDARAALRVRMRSGSTSSVTLRLNSAFSVRSASSDRHGRLLFLRVRNQDSVVLNLPAPVPEGSELTFTLVYSGRLEPQGLDREAMQVSQRVLDLGPADLEPTHVYSNRSYWYPQAPATDYGSATIRLNLPPSHWAVCSGTPAEGSPVLFKSDEGIRRLFVFVTARPVRYLGCAVSRFTAFDSRTLRTADPGTTQATNGDAPGLQLTVTSTARLRSRAKDLLDQMEDVARFYSGLMHEAPYPGFTLAVTESVQPGGHSPPYFAAYNQPLPGMPVTWARDPAAFESYPEFFLAHEVAHQWWGHAIGGQNYHEQWLSEGFAQYFAALYAEQKRGPDVFADIIQHMSGWAVRMSPQGPVYLGYRLGHLKNDTRVLRALVYNKGAMVLHMLRRLTGDEIFFRGLRRFYQEHRFTKTSTDDLRRAFEAESGLDLRRFFEGWIYGGQLPALSHSSEIEETPAGGVLTLRFTQRDQVFDFPVTVSLRLRDGTRQTMILPIRERTVEHRIPLPGPVREVRVNDDRAALIAK